jgi:hypothetical protein
MTRLIGLAGYAGAGKDEVGRILESLGYQKVGFADKVKQLALDLDPVVAFLPQGRILRAIALRFPRLALALPAYSFAPYRLSDAVSELGTERAKRMLSEVRSVYQRLGTEVGRQLDENVWVRQLMKAVDLTTGHHVITDVRFPNEVGMVQSLGGTVWWIERPSCGPLNGHASERSVGPHNADRVIHNDGTLEDLRATVERVARGHLDDLRVH